MVTSMSACTSTTDRKNRGKKTQVFCPTPQTSYCVGFVGNMLKVKAWNKILFTSFKLTYRRGTDLGGGANNCPPPPPQKKKKKNKNLGRTYFSVSFSWPLYLFCFIYLFIYFLFLFFLLLGFALIGFYRCMVQSTLACINNGHPY